MMRRPARGSSGGESRLNQGDLQFVADLKAAELADRNVLAGVLLAGVFLAIVAFVAWAAFADLDEVTIGQQGQIIPVTRDQSIQSTDGGVIQEVSVREGDVVEKGQVLVRIDDTRPVAALREGNSKADGLRAAVARLRAEATGAQLQFEEEMRNSRPDLVALETQAFRSRRSALEDALGARQRQLALAENELKITAPLAEKGIVSEVEVLRLLRQIAEIKGQMRDMRNKFRSDASSELTAKESELVGIGAQVAGRADQVSRTVVFSPIRGIVKNVRFNTAGAVVKSGEEIMQVVPVEDRLLVEAKIRPSDVAFLRPGMEATVKISAYDYTIYGVLPAVIENISANTVRDDVRRDEAFFLVQVRTRESVLHTPNGGVLPIIPGMTASVEILTGRKTVLDYLLKPLLKAREAMRER